jgi:shikimate dehydrogenase
MRALGIAGLSVTMPHKAAAVPLVDRLSPVAEALGAVNCIYRRPVEGGGDGGGGGDELVGDSTDGAGFLASLRRGADFDPAGRRCLVVGAGGAARGIVWALADAGAGEVIVVNRTPARAEVAAALAGTRGRVGEPADAADADLVVQATPAGMAGSPAAGEGPLVDAGRLGPGQVAADLVYHPLVTPWLARAAEQGATVVGGLGMLVHQAATQLEHWTGQPAPVEAMWAAVSP